MVDLEDVPVVGKVVAFGALVGDLVLNSGDLLVVVVVSLGDVLLSNVDLLLPLMSTLNRLADRFEWLPNDLVQTAFTVVLVAAFVSYAARLVTRSDGKADKS